MSKWAFLSHFSFHAGGAMFGGAIQLATISALGWLYGPKAFGDLALFFAVSHTLAIFTSLNLGGYSISLPRLQERLKFAATMVTGTVLFGSISVVCIMVFLLLGAPLTWLAGYWMMPAYVVVQAFSAIFYGLHLAAARTISAAGSLIIRPVLFLIIGLIFLHAGVHDIGLIAAASLSEVLVAGFLIQKTSQIERNYLFRLSLVRWRDNWKMHWRFYLMGGLGAYLSNVAGSTPLLVGGWVMTPAELGSYALAQRLMQAPISMVGAPLGAIVNRILAGRYLVQHNVVPQVVMTYLGGLAAGTAGFGLMAAIVVFGRNRLPQDWVDIGTYAPVVFATGVFLFATSLIAFVPLMIGNVRFLVSWSCFRIIGFILSAFLAAAYAFNPLGFLLLLLTVESIASLLFLIVNTRQINRKNQI